MKMAFYILLGIAISVTIAYMYERQHLRMYHPKSKGKPTPMADVPVIGDIEGTIDEFLGDDLVMG